MVTRGPHASLGERVVDELGHRGPDSSGRRRWSGEWCSWEMAHTRLSIVDLSPAGGQPMANEDGSLVMVFNGEIYNSPELRRFCEAKGHRFSSQMDGEVILHLWEMEGPAALSRLNGIFAVAIASTDTGEVVLARDPLGVKPLYWSSDGDAALWFASELTALAAAGAPLGGEDLVAMAQFLSFLFVPDPRTPFTGAKSLEPGQALRWSPRGQDLFFYGEPLMASTESRPLRREEALVAVRERFREAARRQTLSDVPIGLMASGGVDSGLVWWATSDVLAGAYTIEWPTAGDAGGLRDDRWAVGELERRFATPVDYLAGDDAENVLPLSGDLVADPAFGLTRLIARTARDNGCKVLFSGQGGDELFAGYRRHTIAPLLSPLRLGPAGPLVEQAMHRLPGGRANREYAVRLARAASEGDAFGGYMQLCTYSQPSERARALDCDEAEVTNDVVWQRHRQVHDRLPPDLPFLRKAMALDLAVYLPCLGLVYADRAGMEFGVEIRVPFLDLDFVRWSLTLPAGILSRWGRGKWLTRTVAAEVLSPEIAHRPKRAFGAPRSRVAGEGNTSDTNTGDGNTSDTSSKQAAYVTRACRILDEYRSSGLGSRQWGAPGRR